MYHRRTRTDEHHLHMHTALSDSIGLRGSRRSHRCVNVSIEQLASRCGCFECQSMSVMTRVWARSEWISVGSPDRQVTTSISWLVAMAQYSWLAWQIAHSAADTSCLDSRWNLRRLSSSSYWSRLCRARWRLVADSILHYMKTLHIRHICAHVCTDLPASKMYWPDQSTDMAVACRSRCSENQVLWRVRHDGSLV